MFVDHEQGGATDGTPLLLNTFMYTSFKLIELRESVRAHGDDDFIRLQTIARMCPIHLQQNPHLIEEFRQLVSQKLTFVQDFSDIPPSMLKCYSRKIGANAALGIATEQQIEYFRANQHMQYITVRSSDYERHTGALEWSNATQSTVNALNKKTREVDTFVLSIGSKFEITINDTGADPQFFQSQIGVILQLPSTESIERYLPIVVFIAPAGRENDFSFDDQNNIPTEDDLLQHGWKKVKIGVANSDKIMNVRGNIQAKRTQYALRPLGASTIDKSQGLTLVDGIAIEISPENSPWAKYQVVVFLSRSKLAEKTVIVGNMQYAIDLMCNLIQKCNQYSKLVSGIVKMLTVNGGGDGEEPSYGIDLHNCFPFRAIAFNIPADSCGFAYILYSIRDRRVTYTGETQNLRRRLMQHNSGVGSEGTAPVSLRPWGIGAMIFGPRMRDKQTRLFVEQMWRDSIRNRGRTNVPTIQRIELVREIVTRLNENIEGEGDGEYKYIITVEREINENNNDGEADSITHFSTSECDEFSNAEREMMIE